MKTKFKILLVLILSIWFGKVQAQTYNVINIKKDSLVIGVKDTVLILDFAISLPDSNIIKESELLNLKRCFFQNSKYKIISFAISFSFDGAEYSKNTNGESTIPMYLLKKISTSRVRTMYLDNILIQGPNGSVTEHSLKIKIKYQ